MIDIKDKNGNVRLSVVISDKAVYHKELMTEEYVLLTFETAQLVRFAKGDFINTEFGRFWLVNPSRPKYNVNNTGNGAYQYEQKFHAIWERWKNYKFFYSRQRGFEKSWSLTGFASQFLDIVVDNLADAGFGEYTYVIDSSLTEAKPITFDGADILSALKQIAETYETEWWLEGTVIHLSKCEYGTAVPLAIGAGLQTIEQSQSKDIYITRLYAFGAARNLPKNYRQSEDESAVIEGVVEKRLKLPEGTDHIDAWENLAAEDIVEGVAVFDEIYPRRTGTIESITTKQYNDEEVDEQGETTLVPWNAYRFTDSGIVFDTDYILGEEELRIVFQTGALAGMDFAVIFNPDGLGKSEEGYQLYEIVRNEDYGVPLPNDNFHPSVNDTYILYNWDSTKIAEMGLVSAAEQELLTAATNWLAENSIDPNVYTGTTDPIFCAGYRLNNQGKLVHAQSNEIDLSVGQRVELVDANYFDSGSRVSRVRGFEKSLANKYSCKYTIGNSSVYSRSQQLEEKMADLQHSSATAQNGGSGSSVSLIKQYDSTAPSDFNVYSAKRAEVHFLKRDVQDTAEEAINFAKGLTAGEYEEGARGVGVTEDYDGNWHIDADFLHIRKKLTADTVEVMHASHIGGKLLSTPGSCIIDEVVPIGFTPPTGQIKEYKCYFKAVGSDGYEIQNTFAVNDLAYCEAFNVTNTPSSLTSHFYWRKVTDKGYDAATKRHWIVLSNTDMAGASAESGYACDAPLVGDNVSVLGNTTDTTRQNALIMAGAGNGSPYIAAYQGINSYTLPEAVARISPTGSWIKVSDRNGSLVNITDLIESLETAVEAVQQQEDKQIVMWFGDAVPTLLNEPAVNWTSDDERDEHIKDVYYDRRAVADGGGKAYSFEQDSLLNYEWRLLTDRDVLAALEAAAAAQDTADGKRRVFTARPTTAQAYDVGDLWVNATFPENSAELPITLTGGTSLTEVGQLYNNDILRCESAKESGDPFSIEDWTPVHGASSSVIRQASDAIMLLVKNGLNATGINITDGLITLTADKTLFANPNGAQIALFTTEGLQSNKVQCLDENGNKRLEVDAAGVRMYYPLQSGQTTPQVMKEEIFLFDANGNVSGTETRYYNINGTIKWRLDSAGTLAAATLDEYWTTEAAYIVGSTPMQQLFQNVKTGHRISNEWTNTTGRVTTGSVSRFTSIQGSHESYNGRVANGVIGDSVAPSSSTDWLTGWLMTRLIATYEGKEDDAKLGTYSRHFVFYNNGSPSTCELTWDNNSVIVSELTVEFNVDTHYITDIIYEASTPTQEI